LSRPTARFIPTVAEAASLRFAVDVRSGAWGVYRRLLAAAVLFLAGAAGWALLPTPLAPFGLVLIVFGHGLLWVRSQSNAPGGATPVHEEIWAPVEEDWYERVRSLEERAARWDATPFDLTNGRGFGVLLGVLVAIGVAGLATAASAGFDAAFRVTIGAATLLVPFWINGVRTTWNPSELEKKGEALRAALATWTADGGSDFDPVPMLALREGPHGKYPVDAKLMLRPAAEDGSGFLGVQIQVAMNSVQGTDYPYLYAVVLGKDDPVSPFWLPAPGLAEERALANARGGRRMVYESGQGDGARYLVVRQHADKGGGWHTDERAIGRIVARALELGREAREANRP
jgi:hypothetical protein